MIPLRDEHLTMPNPPVVPIHRSGIARNMDTA